MELLLTNIPYKKQRRNVKRFSATQKKFEHAICTWRSNTVEIFLLSTTREVTFVTCHANLLVVFGP